MCVIACVMYIHVCKCIYCVRVHVCILIVQCTVYVYVVMKANGSYSFLGPISYCMEINYQH